MPEQEEEEKKAVLQIKNADDYRGTFITGAFGGHGPSGVIVADLYHEYRDVEEKIEGSIVEPGVLKVEPKEEEKTIFVRERQIRVYMTAEDAVSIGRWLKKHGENAMEAREEE